MIVTIAPHPLSGTLDAVKSKSYAHRLLIAAALSGGEVDFGDSDDASRTAHALASLGFEAAFEGEKVRFGAFCAADGVREVSVGESGSTLRFLVPLAAALGVSARFVTEGRLGERPMGALANCLAAHN